MAIASKTKTNGTARKRAVKRVVKRVVRPYAAEAREYETLIDKLKLSPDDCTELFDFAPRTSRRYRKGEGKVPVAMLKLMRLMARGVLTKQQVLRA